MYKKQNEKKTGRKPASAQPRLWGLFTPKRARHLGKSKAEKMEAEADRDYAEGRYESFDNMDDFIDTLD